MCYGMNCPYERQHSGECRGEDWKKPNAACAPDLEDKSENETNPDEPEECEQ